MERTTDTGGPLPGNALRHPASGLACGVLIAGLSLALVAGCLTAGFTTYDDAVHLRLNQPVGEATPWTESLKPAANTTYFPVTAASYELDRALFERWLPRLCGSWAPGVRLMTLLYHAAAALVLWRLLLALRFPAGQALFIACAFSVHPLACETVCWVSERKNALAALFGFAALWAWVRLESSRWRIPAAAALYGVALLSKPSALGILPLFLLVELLGGASGLAGAGAMPWRSGRAWLRIGACLLPAAALSAAVIMLNLAGHERTLLPPPGGSIFTALLTDLEILSRYLCNLLAPVALSAAYCVTPIAALTDPRLWLYGALLAGVAAATIGVAQNRRRAAFGWLWFAGALGPSLNLVAISHLMQDRYVYLSTPGFFIVVVEAAAGLQTRLAPAAGRALRLAALVYIAALAALGGARGVVWSNTFALFHDAAHKQPQSAFAHCCLGIAYAQAWHVTKNDPAGDPTQAAEFHRQWIEHWSVSVACPDADRALFYAVMANRVGEELSAAGQAAAAERYWELAAHPPPQLPDQPDYRAKALANLAALRLQQDRPGEALALADEAVKARDRDTTRLVRARALLAWAEEAQRQGITPVVERQSARRDLESIAPNSKVYAEAQKLLEHRLLKP